jgi:UDP-N-acetyl-D-mannosaminuronic acid dehydrogenase
MQLAAFTPDHFPMGHSAMLVNEGFPEYLLEVIEQDGSIKGKTLGILGMAFKGDSDDPRDSLSYKLRKLATFRGAKVVCSDPFIPDPTFRPADEVLGQADVVVIGAPHTEYRGLSWNGGRLVDMWGVSGAIVV